MLGAIGDTVLAAATLQDVKRVFPQATLVGFAAGANVGTFDLIDGLDEIVTVPVTRPLAAITAIRNRRVDILVDFGQWSRISALLAACSSAGCTVGFRTPGQRRHFAYDVAVPHSAGRHEIDNFRALLEPLGITSTREPCLSDGIRAEARRDHRDRLLVFHPWAAGYRAHLREWPQDRWVELGGLLAAEGYTVIITGGPADRPRAEALADAIGRPEIRVAAGIATLRETAVIIAGAAAVVCVNTGTMHVAAALGVPTIALHGPTNPARWGPRGDKTAVLGPGLDQGGAYLNLGFEYPASPRDSMGAIAVANVAAALRRFGVIAADRPSRAGQ